PSDNKNASATIAAHTNYDNSTSSQPLITHTLNNNTDNINFASAAAMEKTPSREQAIVFNSIDGVPQIEYILAIGKLVKPKKKKIVSRISNNRFCIFLLINPAKRFIISNVCTSIPNQAIIDALKNTDIIPISQITHLKAGISVEGYGHIMSFRRQMYINHENIPKLPRSLLINVNENQFRVFFTDDKITCFLCKSVGHTTINCKKNTENKSISDHLLDSNVISSLDVTTESKETELSSPTNNISVLSHISSPNETYKRPFSESSSSKPLSSPNNPNSPKIIPNKEIVTKKPKMRSRSNSSTRREKPYEEGLNTKHYKDIHRAKFSIQPIAFCFQETNLRPNTSFQIRGFNGYFKNRQTNLRASGGDAIFINILVESMEIPIQSTFEIIAVSLHLKKPMCICNIYLPDSSNFSLNELNSIISQLPKPFIFLGDLNSRNVMWGSNYKDIRGKIVEKFLDNDEIILLNTGEHTRHNVVLSRL
ncbi:Transposon TX1 uncharacterized protein, partial [Aphis craccivora]